MTALVAIALLAGGAATAATADSAELSGAPDAAAALEGGVACRVAIEEVLWSHRIWPAENPEPKPAFDRVAAAAALEPRVEDALRQSTALTTLYGQPVTGAMLQAELDRMAKESRQPEVLHDIFAALGDDPARLAECLARPVLADRLLSNFYRHDARFAKQRQPFRAWWEVRRNEYPAEVSLPEHDYILPEIVGSSGPPDLSDRDVTPEGADTWRDTPSIPNAQLATAVWTGAEMIFWGGLNNANGGKENYGWSYNPATDSWSNISHINAPQERAQHTAVWTGAEMIVWGGCNRFGISFCTVNSGGRYNPGTDTWNATSIAGAPAPRVGHSAVWAGSSMIVWGGCTSAEHCNETNTGGLYNPVTDTWTATTTGGAPSARNDHTAVWTGSEMIVWGGYDGNALATGGRYNPGTNSWTPTSLAGAPAPRLYQTAVWVEGDGLPGEMIVWGGCDSPVCFVPDQGNYFGDGARYNPATNAWTPVGPAGAPSPRILHSAIWTGNEMIVWGGTKPTQVYNDGARYSRTSNTWTPTSNAGTARSNHRAVWTGELMIVWGGSSRSGERYSPAANAWTPVNGSDPYALRSDHTAVWTGTEMIAWGGSDTPWGTFYGSGNIYTPATASWRDTSLTGAPNGRYFHTAVWTGSKMIVWGGQDGPIPFKNGGIYNPVADSWQPTPTQGAPAARGSHTAVWTGRYMVVWGGLGTGPHLNTGGAYDTVQGRWRTMPITGAPSGRYLHTAVWTGNEMIVWGGVGAAGYLNDGARFNPLTKTWTALPQANAPSARYYATSVWTGQEMIVWGGRSGTVDDPTHYDTGARYRLATNTWTPMTVANAPQARSNHTAVWTGAEMIVWGGWGGDIVSSGQLYTGGRYNPAGDSWTATDEAGSPSARTKHTAVWTGSEMIVWGGEEDGYLNTGGHYVP